MYQAILLASYGGPETIDDIVPFLDRILSGKPVSSSRREAIIRRYKNLGGKSPLPNECRRFLSKLERRFADIENSPQLYWGNLYSSPTFDNAFIQMEKDKIESVLIFISSIFGSPQSCGRYRSSIISAFTRRSAEFKQKCSLTFIPPFFDLPAFHRAAADSLLSALAWDTLENNPFTVLKDDKLPSCLLLFTAHSIPTLDGEKSQYRRQFLTATIATLQTYFNAPSFGIPKEIVNSRKNTSINVFPHSVTFSKLNLGKIPLDLEEKLKANSLDVAAVFQSRSGSPSSPWLEPDVKSFLREYQKKNPNLQSVIVFPIGFFFENVETIFDLDIELQTLCNELKLHYHRAKCVGSTEQLVTSIFAMSQLPRSTFPNCHCTATYCNCDLSCRLRNTR